MAITCLPGVVMVAVRTPIAAAYLCGDLIPLEDGEAYLCSAGTEPRACNRV